MLWLLSAPMHTRVRTLTQSLPHARSPRCTHSHPYSYTFTYTFTYIRARTHTRMHTHPHLQARAHTHTRAHTRTRAHTQCTQLHVTVLTHTLFTSARAPTTPNVALNPTLSHSLIPCSVLRNCTGLWDLSVVPVLLLC